LRVQFAEPEPSGFALLIGGLIEQNLDRDPGRNRYLDGVTAAVVASDADAAVTIRLGPGSVVVYEGVEGDPQVVVTASSDKLLQMTAAPLRFGLPDAFTGEGRDVLADVLAGRVKVKGLVRSPWRVAQLTRILSVR
jgi:hypothetical protein